MPQDTIAQMNDSYDQELEMVQNQNPLDFSEWQDAHMLVCLSGRATFEGSLVAADKAKFAAVSRDILTSSLDLDDTLNRMKFAARLAKKIANAKGRFVPIYFNGTKEHNASFRKLLAAKGQFAGLPAQCFIIDDIPLDNTIGQAIGLNSFLADLLTFSYNKLTLVLVTGSYHVPRVSRTFANNSPLLTKAFYRDNPIVERFSHKQRQQILTQNFPLRDATMYVYGVDRFTMHRPGAMHDIGGEKAALVTYAIKQNPPSLPSYVGNNMCMYYHAIVRRSLRNATLFAGCNGAEKESRQEEFIEEGKRLTMRVN